MRLLKSSLPRRAKKDSGKPAVVRYARLEGTREQKLKKLASIKSSADLGWKKISADWQASFRPLAKSIFMSWPQLIDLMPWQYSGLETKRNWPIAPDKDTLIRRWSALLASKNRPELMKVSGDRTVELSQRDFLSPYKKLPAISSLAPDTLPHKIVRLGFRSFDRQWILADNRVISRPRFPLWQAHSDGQIYLSCLFNHPLGTGPALTACANIPDRHHYRGSYGGKDILPLYRDPEAHEPNFAPGLLDKLSNEFGKPVTAEDFVGYIYAVLAQPEYTARFVRELGSREVRVPLTKIARLFFKAAEFGRFLIWLHTYGERLAEEGRPAGSVPSGKAKCLKAVSDAEDRYPNEFKYDADSKKLRVGDGIFGPVEPEVYNFEVSGLQVVKSWLGYRMKERSGRKSSPLDDIRPKSWTREFTREFLELLWVLEKTVEGYPRQKKLFDEILAGPLFLGAELPGVPDEAREAPEVARNSLGPQIEIPFESEND